MAALKVFIFMAMLTIMVVVCLSTSLAIVPEYAPSWMAPAWNVLEALPLWEVRDSMISMSKWVTQLLPGADFLTSLTDLCVELGQKLCRYWIISGASILFLGLVARWMHRVVRIKYSLSAMTEPAGDHLPANTSSKEPEVNGPDSTPALVEQKVMNIPTTMIIEEKKDEKKGAQKRVESPAPKATKEVIQTNKEDVPPQVRQKHSEFRKETKDARKRHESPAPRAAKPAGTQVASGPSTSRQQEFHALRQRSMVDKHLAGRQQGAWNQGGNVWPSNAWQGGAWQGAGWQGNAWAGHHNGGQRGRNGWY
jgi:hypothetical protein